jgi:thiol-disulfide isomerase/thioredoxin
MRFLTLSALFALTCCAASPQHFSTVVDLAKQSVDPLADTDRVRVVLFARSDCPITKRYAPEMQRLAHEFEGRKVEFWIAFPDKSETVQDVQALMSEYHFPGTPVLDSKQELVRVAHASVAPEAAVFDLAGKLLYHGRIDDLYVDIGKSRQAPTTHDLEDAISAALNHAAVRNPATQAIGCSLADVE